MELHDWLISNTNLIKFSLMCLGAMVGAIKSFYTLENDDNPFVAVLVGAGIGFCLGWFVAHITPYSIIIVVVGLGVLIVGLPTRYIIRQIKRRKE